MKKCIVLLCACVLFAQDLQENPNTKATPANPKVNYRDNPFESLISPKAEEHRASKIQQEPLSTVEFVLPSTARVIKNIQITYQNLDGSLENKTIQLDESIDWHYPLLISQRAQNATYTGENRFKLGEFELVINKEKIFVATRKKMLRDFILPEPYRLVLDVAGVKDNIQESVKMNKKYFLNAEVTTHEDFYRISISLDGRYKYSITPQRDGFVIALE